MGLDQSVKLALIRYVDFFSRSGRREFFYFIIFSILVLIIFLVMANIFGAIFLDNYSSGFIVFFTFIWFLIFFIPLLSITSRRLHDINRSGLWQFISLTGIGTILILFWVCKKGDEGDNKYGHIPVTSTLEIELNKVEELYKKDRISEEERTKLRHNILK